MRGQHPSKGGFRRPAGIALLCTVLPGCSSDEPPVARDDAAPASAVEPAARPASLAQEPSPGFAPNDSCAECHQREHDHWIDSHHDLAMQPVTEETVLGDFDDASFEHDGITTRFFRREGRYWIATEGPDGTLTDFPVAYVFGVEPLQQYLVEFPGGALQCVTVAWDTERGRWFDLYPDDDFAHDDAMHWTGRYQTWNAMCAECHSTDLRKRYDPATDSYRTTWHEIDVSCQACHGPGEAHVRWARDYESGLTDSEDRRLVVDYAANDGRYQVDTCARCHSRRHRVSPEDGHGRTYLDDFMPEMLRAGLYYPDGQILEEVYVYGSFLQSRMHHEGVRCTDCHDAHSTQLIAPPDALCVRCHQEHPPEEFPTLQYLLYRKRYDTPEHHFHEPGSAGASCVACHMPQRNYMVVDPRHDHGFRVPRPDLSVALGVPNTCNACHTDRSAQWASDQVAEWYGTKRRETPHFAFAFAAGRDGRPEAAGALAAIAADGEQPAIVRGTALELLQRYGPPAGDAIIAACADPDPLVRAVAVSSLDALAPDRRAEVATPLLDDPVGAVRFEAARVLSSVPRELIDPSWRSKLNAAISSFRDTQLAVSDLPAGRLNVGMLHVNLGRPELAEASYTRALRMDPAFLPASFNLANLYNGLGRNDAAERVLRDALRWSPDEGELHYSLGLVLAETGRVDEAVVELGRAADLLPERARVHYNRGLALQHLGQLGEAESALLLAHELAPRDVDMVYALTVMYIQQERRAEARDFAQQLLEIAPDDPGVREFVAQVMAR